MNNHYLIKKEINKLIYINLIRKILFSQDSERVHNLFIALGKKIGRSKMSKKLLSSMFSYENNCLEQRYFGIKFKNPVGLSAGFDKNAEIADIMDEVGFGFAEIGSITAKPCLGNQGKRLSRLIKEKSLWVNFGLNNIGADEISHKLKNEKFTIPIGINIAKTNCKETCDNEIAIEDYLYTLEKIKNLGSYFTINISCPNSFGGQPFSKPELYSRLMKRVKKLKIKKPIFVKISPDLKKRNIDQIIKISLQYGVRGFICTNLTKEHRFGKGGLSGKSLEKKSDNLLSYVYHRVKKSKKEIILIGSGGIFSAEDAYRKIKLGANLVQILTGMIYNGPGLIGEINYNLTKLLKKDGFSNIRQAIGSAYIKMGEKP